MPVDIDQLPGCRLSQESRSGAEGANGCIDCISEAIGKCVRSEIIAVCIENMVKSIARRIVITCPLCKSRVPPEQLTPHINDHSKVGMIKKHLVHVIVALLTNKKSMDRGMGRLNNSDRGLLQRIIG